MPNGFVEAELHEKGFCVLRSHFSRSLIEACGEALSPRMGGLDPDSANRGPHRHFLPLPFDPPCFAPKFFFDDEVLSIVRAVIGERFVADQWGCDIPLLGSTHQEFHRDYKRPLFEEAPDLMLPAYMLVVSFGLVEITLENGPLEVAPGTHRMPMDQALREVERCAIVAEPVPLAVGDVLIRHPWALHRGTPNSTASPRPLCTIRYVRRWYADASRDVATIPLAVWRSLSSWQQERMRFPIESVGS